MPTIIDLTTQQFGRLTVLRQSGKNKWNCAEWECLCLCGKTVIVGGYNLRKGRTKSCGCLSREKAKERFTTHGEEGTRLYITWRNMKARCQNYKHKQYKDWGGRGITVCEEWQEYIPFRDWAMANGYQENLTIDRIDNNDGMYEPNNCRWITQAEQNRNYRRNIMVNGLCLKDYCEKFNLPYHTIKARITRLKWPIEVAISQPIFKYKKATEELDSE